jgi:hypothetical protein
MKYKIVIGNLNERDLLGNVAQIENNIKIDIKEMNCLRTGSSGHDKPS